MSDAETIRLLLVVIAYLWISGAWGWLGVYESKKGINLNTVGKVVVGITYPFIVAGAFLITVWTDLSEAVKDALSREE